MSDFKIDNIERDLVISGGDFVLLDEEFAIAQDIARRCRTCLGDWILDAEVGIPYYQYIFVKNPNRMIIDSIFKQAILSAAQVSEVKRINFDYNLVTRTFTLREVEVVRDTGLPFIIRDLVIEV